MKRFTVFFSTCIPAQEEFGIGKIQPKDKYLDYSPHFSMGRSRRWGEGIGSGKGFLRNSGTDQPRLAPVLETFFHQCVISYNCSQSNSDGSVLNIYTCSQ